MIIQLMVRAQDGDQDDQDQDHEVEVKGPVAADNARNTSSLVVVHPRQTPWASHLLHYDASTNIILNVSISRWGDDYCSVKVGS